MALSKYENSRFYFASTLQLQCTFPPDFTENDIFQTNNGILKTEDIELNISLYKRKDSKSVFLLFRRSNVTGKRKKLDATIVIQKIQDETPAKISDVSAKKMRVDDTIVMKKIQEETSTNVVSRRVLIPDLTQCTIFDCSVCKVTVAQPQTCPYSYMDLGFCSFDTLKGAIRGDLSGAKTLLVSVGGFVCSYGKYEKGKVMSPAGSLMPEMEFSDVKIISADGREFCAHKIILAAHSNVFGAMLTTDMKEKNTGVIELDDLCSSGLEELLNFIYKGELNDDTVTNITLLLELLRTGDKYNITTLIEYCAELIWLMPGEYIKSEDAIELFIVSQQIKLRLLQEKALQILKIKEATQIADLIGITIDKLHGNEGHQKIIRKLLAIIIVRCGK